MGLFNSADPYDAFEDLLARERAAIMDGQYDRLVKLTEEKERLLAALEAADRDAVRLEQLRETSERNGILLDAMRAGVESALMQVKAMRAPRPELQTYDKTGQVKTLPGQAQKSGHRA